MTEFFVFLYGMLAMFVILSIRRNQRMQRPSPAMVTAMGWGLFSLSTTLAVLMAGLALALAMGFSVSFGLAVPAA
jgi:hypothetical protein